MTVVSLHTVKVGGHWADVIPMPQTNVKHSMMLDMTIGRNLVCNLINIFAKNECLVYRSGKDTHLYYYVPRKIVILSHQKVLREHILALKD